MSPRRSSLEALDSIEISQEVAKNSQSALEQLMEIGTDIIIHERSLAVVRACFSSITYNWFNDRDYNPGLHIQAQLKPDTEGRVRLTNPERSQVIGRLAVTKLALTVLNDSLDMIVTIDSRNIECQTDTPFDYEVLAAFKQWRKKPLHVAGALQTEGPSV